MQRNFILTDVMRTGFHQDLEQFIDMHTMPDQSIEHTGDWYTLHDFDLDSYDRKLAIIDIRQGNYHLKDSKEFMDDLRRRCDLLHSQGFKFVKSTPWECNETFQSKDGHGWPILDIDHIRWTGGVSWFWFFMYRKHNNAQITAKHDTKKFDFLFLNKTNKVHRTKLINAFDGNFFNESLYSNWPNIKLPHEYEQHFPYPLRGKDQDIVIQQYSDTKFSLLSESSVNNNEVFITERLWKSVIAEHPFVVHGNHLYLQKLREMGFKTFSKYFDESYDLESDNEIRIKKIVDTCIDLKKSNWKDLYLQTQDLRKHNKELFFNKEKLGEQINNTLNLFFEFVDGS
jgi:hypothetical protein